MDRQKREIDEDVVKTLTLITATMIRSAVKEVGAGREEIVYGVLTGLFGATDDGGQSFVDFVFGAMSEVVHASDLEPQAVQAGKGLH